jgi:predicted ATPase/DNA-binding SARP family transcriptional activator
MEFRILGPLEAGVDGKPVELPAAKQRALLAILLLRANEPVSSELLIDELWGGAPPRSARKLLQTYVSKLRRVLGDKVLVTHPAGYAVRVEPGQLDLYRFGDLVDQAREAQPREAAQKLRAALALWRGPPLADFRYDSFAQTAIGRLEELRLVTIEARIDADLAVGRHGDVVGELRGLVTEYPLRERLRGQLMVALYRSGRQAEALAVYRDGRRRLVDELGIEPSRFLADLERAILEQDARLALPVEPTARPTLRPRPTALPTWGSSFVGRSEEMDSVQAHLGRPDLRLLTLTGPGGAGKTRLAVEVAVRLTADFRDGVLFVDLAAVRDPALVAFATVQAIGLRGIGPAEAPSELAAYLRPRRVLVIFDNFEQVLPAAPGVAALLTAAPAVKIIVTSRAPLRVPEEHIFPVPPLALPAAGVDLATLARGDAVALFLERARAARPDFALVEMNAAPVATLCVRLDGLPLALELAAARVSLLSPRAILARLGRRLDVLKSNALDIPERHRTLRAAIEWSYELLDTNEQALFRRLGVFVGGFTVDEAEAVAPETDLDVLDGVESLLHANLLRAEGTAADEPRFGMLETIREYALERLARHDEADGARNRHARFYQGLAQRAEPELRGPGQARWLEVLDAEYDNLRAALAWAAQGGEASVGLETGAALWRFWQMRGHIDEGREQLERLLETNSGSPAVRAAAELSAARCAFIQGDFAGMQRFVEDSIRVHRRIRENYSVGFALMITGTATATRGDFERGQAYLYEALSIARSLGDTWLESSALGYLGIVLIEKGDFTAARRALEDGLRWMRELGDRRSVGWMLISLGRVALGSSDHDRARLRFDEALAVERRLGDLWGIATSLHGLACVAIADGRYGEVRGLLGESIRVAWGAHDRPSIAADLDLFARFSAVQGRLPRAGRLYGSASVLDRALHSNPLQSGGRSEGREIAEVRTALGEEEFAEVWAQGRAMTIDQAVAYALDDRECP